MSQLQTTQLDIPEGTIDFGIGQPTVSLLPLDALREAAEHRLSQGNAEMLQYGADLGDGYFRNALAGFLSGRYRTPVDLDHLLVTAGASQALDLICTRFTKPGDTIFVEEPTYFLALLVFRDHGLNVVGIPMDGDGMRIDALEDALKRHRPVLLYTIPTFQNPSAITLPADRRKQLVALAEKHDFLIVADEVYHLLDFGTAPPPPMSLYGSDRVLSLGSFSKICAPGLRLGWVQAASARLDVLVGAGLIESGGGLNPFTSKIMQSMMELGLQDACLDSFRNVYRERAAALSSALRDQLPACSFVEPRGGFFIWLQLPGGHAASDLQTTARRNGLNFQPGTRFAGNGRLSNFIRLSFAYYDTPQLVEGVTRLAGLLR